MKKKNLAIVLAILAVVMCFTLAACNGENKDNSLADETTLAADDTTAGAEDTTAAKIEEMTESDIDYITKKGKLVVGMTKYEPMNYLDENNEWTGFDTEFAQAVAKELGLDVEFIEIDWDNKFFELSARQIDCVWNGMTITDEAKLNSSVSDAYVKNAQVVVMKNDKIADYKDADSIKDLAFAVESGSAGQKELDALGITGYTAVSTQADALLEVSSGAADACVIDITMANAMTGEGTSYANLGYELELSTEEYGIAFRKGSDMTAKVNDIIADMKADGTLKALADKYELTLA